MATFDRIEKIEVLSDTPSVVFSNIPTNYDDLFIIGSVRSSRAGVNADGFGLYFNSQSSGNLARWGYNVGGTIYNYYQPSGATIGLGNIPATTSTSNSFSTVSIYVPNYLSSEKKSCIIHSAWASTNSNSQGSHVIAGLSPLTQAINSITLQAGSANIVAGSTFSLFGLNSQGTSSIRATGGFIERSGGYIYHKFTSSNTLTVNQTTNVEYLIVAGGGGGGAGCCGDQQGEGGGGGAGGMITGTTTLSPGAYSIVVGAGGSGATINTQASGSNGSNSSVTTLTTAIGGGGGGGRATPGGVQIGKNGGSGGGSGQRDSFTDRWGSGTAGQGNRGGNGWNSNGVGIPSSGGGGGGGKGGIGANAGSAQIGGNGGIGEAWPTDGTGKYYAGGGGGACYGEGTASIPGQGGLGGGGNGAWNFGPTSGEAFTGGGGGGGGGDLQGYPGGNGGSGIVIIRYT